MLNNATGFNEIQTVGKFIGQLISFQKQNQKIFFKGKKKKRNGGGSHISKQNRTKLEAFQSQNRFAV